MPWALAACIGALGEPVTFQALAPSTFDPVLAITQLGVIFLPLATASFGFVAWRSSREAASTAAPPRV